MSSDVVEEFQICSSLVSIDPSFVSKSVLVPIKYPSSLELEEFGGMSIGTSFQLQQTLYNQNGEQQLLLQLLLFHCFWLHNVLGQSRTTVQHPQLLEQQWCAMPNQLVQDGDVLAFCISGLHFCEH